MSDPYEAYYPQRRPFYRRVWFIVLCVLLALPLLTVGFYYVKLKIEYGGKAATLFDFSKMEEMESASTIYDRENGVLGRIFLENRDAVPFSEFPYALTQAVIAAEDNRFYQHHGVDLVGMARAALKNFRAHGIKQGASTLTQQLARNTFPAELPSRDRSYGRKILECFVAEEIEARFSKQKILEMYLNRVYFGNGFYGAEAAARGYFGKLAKEMSLSECATLAGMLKNPNNLSPWSNRQACIETRNFVLGRMLELKQITPAQYHDEIARNLAVKNRHPIHTDSYAIDMIRQQVNDIVGKDQATAEGYRIYTTIDAAMQKTAQESLRAKLTSIENREGYEHQTLAQYNALLKEHKQDADSDEKESAVAGPGYLQGSAVVLENATGGILALIGGRDFLQSQFNRVLSAARPAGTAFVPLVYAAAFEKGIFPGTLFQDAIIDNRQVMIGGTTGILGEWGPESVDNKYEGPIPARTALVKSKNAATVRVGMQTGLDNVIALARKAGLVRSTGKDEKGREVFNLRRYPATFLGSSEVTLMDMTLAYTTFPNGGWRPAEPFIIKRIEDKEGHTIFESKPERTTVCQDTTAYEVHSCLAQVLEQGTGDKAFSQYGLKKFPVAGKTGTAYNFTDDWFIGYDSAITCGIWAGFDKPSPIYRGAFSNEVALPIWVDIMNSTFGRYPPVEIPQPHGIKKYEICLSSGLLATDNCNEAVLDKATGETVEHRTTYFEIGTEAQAPKQSCTVHGANGQGLALSTMPISNVPTQSQYPRATLAVDLNKVSAVPMKAPTVTGEEDPYGAVKPVLVLPATPVIESGTTPAPATAGGSPAPAASASPEETQVRRAEPVRALDQPAEDATIKLDPPPAIQF